MLPEAKGEDLLYVSNEYLFDTGVGYDVLVFSYPFGRHVGTLSGFRLALGECSDKEGDVFIGGWAGNRDYSIAEFAHGGQRPIRTLRNPYPFSCSVDPVTGDLAVTMLTSKIAIYRRAQGRATLYKDAVVANQFFCGYDDRGDLFVDGTERDGKTVVFAELPKGARTFRKISLNYSLGIPGQVQWADGRVAIADQANAIYRFAISGQTGTREGTTQLHFRQPGNGWIKSFWIEASDIAVAFCCPSAGGFKLYKYPAGGRAVKTVQHGFGIPLGITVSLAK